MGKMAFISGEQRSNFKGNRGTKTILGNRGTKTILETREHKKIFFSIVGNQGSKPIYFRGTREQVPRLEGLLFHNAFIPKTDHTQGGESLC